MGNVFIADGTGYKKLLGSIFFCRKTNIEATFVLVIEKTAWVTLLINLHSLTKSGNLQCYPVNRLY